jgi:DNA-binding MarR family transcriptional regulator
MGDSETLHILAGELSDVLPLVGRLIMHHVNASVKEKTTLIQTRVLFALLEHPLTTSELARRRKSSLQSASVLVQGLVERGWVVRVPDPDDRRQFRLEVTPEGKEHARFARAHVSNYLAGLLHELSEEEIVAAQVFLPALKRLMLKHFIPDDELEEFTKE